MTALHVDLHLDADTRIEPRLIEGDYPFVTLDLHSDGSNNKVMLFARSHETLDQLEAAIAEMRTLLRRGQVKAVTDELVA